MILSIVYAGDLHGFTENFHHLDTAAEEFKAAAIIQTGDLAIFWPGESGRVFKYFEKRARQGKHTTPWYFCDGNHDVHDRLESIWREKGEKDVVEVAPGLFHVRRGAIVTIGGVKHLFCGGARSTDRGPGNERNSRGHRIWWADEIPTQHEFEKFFKALDEEKPDVVVTHEAPQRVFLSRKDRETDVVANTFEKCLQLSSHVPKEWLFGHHHILRSWSIDKTDFTCCGKHGNSVVIHDDGTKTLLPVVE